MEKQLKISFLPYFLAALLAITIYFLIYLPLELLLSEFLFVAPSINPWVNTGVLLFFLLIANLFKWEKIIDSRKKLTTLLALFAVAFVFYDIYHQEKLNREFFPKIFQVKPSWVIQGQLIEIKGVNFGPIFKKGKVMVNGMEFLVKDWGEQRIVAETPVPNKDGNFYLYIETKDGKNSNSLPLEVKNPDYLKIYLK